MSELTKRTCGECTACCFTHSASDKKVPVTGLFEWCKHCNQGLGCSIYETRPLSCSVYRCMWLSGSSWPEDMRPDRWGIILDAVDIPGETVTLVYVWECIEGRYASPDIQKLIQGFVETGKYVIAGWRIDGSRDARFPHAMTEENKMRFAEAVKKKIEERMEEALAVGE